MIKEFKEFIVRGNVLDLAIAFILGGAFGKIVTSLVTDLLMPPIGLVLGRVDFTNLFINLSSQNYSKLAEAKAAGAPTLNYGVFLNTVIEFLIVAFAIFFVVRAINRLRRRDEAPKPSPVTRECPFCISNIPLKATRCPSCTSELTAA